MTLLYCLYTRPIATLTVIRLYHIHRDTASVAMIIGKLPAHGHHFYFKRADLSCSLYKPSINIITKPHASSFSRRSCVLPRHWRKALILIERHITFPNGLILSRTRAFSKSPRFIKSRTMGQDYYTRYASGHMYYSILDANNIGVNMKGFMPRWPRGMLTDFAFDNTRHKADEAAPATAVAV